MTEENRRGGRQRRQRRLPRVYHLSRVARTMLGYFNPKSSNSLFIVDDIEKI